MIDTLFLANKIETILNANSLGIKFLVFADEGDLRKSVKIGANVHKYTHAILQTLSSAVTPIKNISFETINTQLMVLVDLLDEGFQEEGANGRPQSRNLINVKACLEELLQEINGKTVNWAFGDKTYNISIGMSQATNGQKMSFGEMADCLPLYVSISFSAFENGVNANDIKILINGEDMYYTQAKITKIKTADQNNIANKNTSRTTLLVGGKEIDLVLPCIASNVGRLIMHDIISEDSLNNAVAVEIVTPLETDRFIGVLGTNVLSLDVNNNAGYNVSVLQGNEAILNYGSSWYTRIATKPEYTETNVASSIIYWGDGTSTKTDMFTSTVTHKYTDQLLTHNIYIYKYEV